MVSALTHSLPLACSAEGAQRAAVADVEPFNKVLQGLAGQAGVSLLACRVVNTSAYFRQV